MPDGTPHLTATYRRLAALCPPLALRLTGTDDPRDHPAKFTPTAYPPGPGADAGGVERLVDGACDRILAGHGIRPRRDVAASRLLHGLLWSTGLLVTGPWFLTGRVPRIPAGRLTADPATGVLALDMHGLAPGPAGAGPAQVRAAVAEHVAPLLEAFAPATRRGRRALWGMAADDLASGLHHLGRAVGDEQAGVRAAERVLPGGTAPFTGAAAFRTLHAPSGRRHVTRTRTGCCLSYAIGPADPCVTCPRLTDGDRLRRLEDGARAEEAEAAGA